MTAKHDRQQVLSTPETTPARQIRILVVGDLTHWRTLGRLQDAVAGCDFVELGDLHDLRLRQIDPDLVLSPLVANGFDAIDVVERLIAAKFAGQYCAVATDIADTAMICAEISAMAPDLAFDLVVLPPRAAR